MIDPDALAPVKDIDMIESIEYNGAFDIRGERQQNGEYIAYEIDVERWRERRGQGLGDGQ